MPRRGNIGLWGRGRGGGGLSERDVRGVVLLEESFAVCWEHWFYLVHFTAHLGLDFLFVGNEFAVMVQLRDVQSHAVFQFCVDEIFEYVGKVIRSILFRILAQSFHKILDNRFTFEILLSYSSFIIKLIFTMAICYTCL